MKKTITFYILCSFLLTVLSFQSYAQPTNAWNQKGDFGGIRRAGAVGFSIGTKGYLGTGVGSSDSLWRNDFWEYDPSADSWTQKADLGGTPRIFAVGFSIGLKGYVGTGLVGYDSLAGSFTQDFWEFDPTTNTWTQKADFGGMDRYGAVGFSIGSKGYLGTGNSFAQDHMNDFWEYDPAADTWTALANLAGPGRTFATGFSIGNKGYIGTGNIGGSSTNDFYEYDPLTDSWAAKASFGGLNRYGAFGTSDGTYGYIGTGRLFDKTNLNDFWIYNPVSDTWAQRAKLGDSIRTFATGFNIGDKIYVGTGEDSHFYFGDIWEYNTTCIPPTFTSEPVNQSITYGDAASYTVVATDAISYQWQEDTGSGFVDITDGGIYSNATTSTLDISLPTVAMSGFKYRCVVTGNCLPASTTNGNATLTVAAKPIVITPDADQSKVYGSADPTPFSYTFAPPLVGTDAITGLMDRVSGEDTGTYAYTIGTLSAGSNYSLTVALTPTFSITPLAILITPDAGQTKIYGSSDPTPFTYTFAPALVGSDVITGTMDRVAGEDIGTYDYTIGTMSAGSNYTLSVALTPTFSITPLAVLITPDAGQTKVYGSSDPTPFTYTFAPALIGSDVITGTMDRVAGEDAGNYAFTIGTLTAGANYSLSVAITPDFVVTMKGLTVTAEDKTKCFDGLIYADPYTVMYSGFVNAEDQSVLSGSLVFGGTAVTATDPGNYSIDPSGLTSLNYSISYVKGALDIKPTPATPIISRNIDTLFSSAATGNQWYKDGLEITGSTDPKFLITTNGVYYTIVTDNGCSSPPSNSISVIDAAIKEVSTAIFDIYPNPSNGEFSIKLKTAGNERYNIEVYNNIGVLVWKQNSASFSASNITKINLNAPTAGLYTVILRNKTNSFAKKVSITK